MSKKTAKPRKRKPKYLGWYERIIVADKKVKCAN